MATHSRILAWKIPWTEEPGGSQSMRLQRVRHNRALILMASLEPNHLFKALSPNTVTFQGIGG